MIVMMVKILTRFAIHSAQTHPFSARNFDPEIVTIVVMVKFLTRFATHLPQTRSFSARSFGQEIVAIVMRIEFLERCSSTSHKIRSKPHNSLSEAALVRELRNQNGGPPALRVYSSPLLKSANDDKPIACHQTNDQTYHHVYYLAKFQFIIRSSGSSWNEVGKIENTLTHTYT